MRARRESSSVEDEGVSVVNSPADTYIVLLSGDKTSK